MTNISDKWWILLLVMVSTFMAVLDTTIVNVGLTAMMHSFSSPLMDVEWVVTGYLLSMCVMLPSAGWFAQKWGYKRLFIIGMVIFTTGSLLCSLSNTLPQLVGSRVVEGFGSGIIQPLGMAMVAREFDRQQRGLALGLWAVASAASVSMGPYLGGLLLEAHSWHSLFVVNIPIGLVTTAGAWMIMKESHEESTGNFDLRGFLYIGLGLPMLVVALSLGSNYGWSSPWIVALIVLSLLAIYLFVKRSLTISSPILDLSIFRFRSFTISIVALSFFSIGLFAGNYLLPIYLEHILGYSTLAAGMAFLPVGIIQGSLAPLTGVLSRFTGHKRLIVAGLVVFVSYFLISTLFTTHTPHWLIMLSLYMRGIGIGLAFTPLNDLAVSELKRNEMASASGMANTVKQLSGSLGIAIFTALISSRVAHHALTIDSSEAYVGAISTSFLIAAILAAVGLVVVLFIREARQPVAAAAPP
ncbi:MAG: DHA2 family efflux MFS transporter permease subunit, partial [Mucinivorans sp.]